MLGKLWKHEWRATWKVPTFLVALNLFCCTAAGLSFSLPIWDTDWPGNTFSAVMVLLLFYFTVIASTLGITVYMAVRYYKNMYTDEGYLTFTLPVGTHQLLLSKLLVAGIWQILVALTAGIALIVTILMFVNSVVSGSLDRSIWEMFQEISEDPFVMQMFQELFGDGKALHYVAVLLILYLLIPFFSMAQMFCALTLGQLFQKHRVLMGVVFIIVLNFVTQLVNSVLQIPVSAVTLMQSGDGELNFYLRQYDVTIVTNIVLGVALYFVMYRIVTKRLNLE